MGLRILIPSEHELVVNGARFLVTRTVTLEFDSPADITLYDREGREKRKWTADRAPSEKKDTAK